MDTYDDTTKKVEITYKNILDDLGPCIKQLVVAGRTYLKSIHGMNAAHRNYNEALGKVANLADNSMMNGSIDIGAAIRHYVKVNKEMLAHQANLLKSLEFDFLEPMEIAADKDTKLIGRERKRFQQLQKSRKVDFEKSVSTLKKTQRKKSMTSDKQLTQMKIMENSKIRLEEFCDESLKEAIVQERMLYGTILEKLCSYSRQAMIYHNKGADLLQSNIRNWERLADTKDILPNNYIPVYSPLDGDVYSIYAPGSVNGISETSSMKSENSRNQPQAIPTVDSLLTPNSSYTESSLRKYARDRSQLPRARSEYNISKNLHTPVKMPTLTPPCRYSYTLDSDDNKSTHKYVRALYPYVASGEYQMSLNEDDIIQFIGEENSSGWQFGDNLTTKKSGWFPLSYTERMQSNENQDTLKNSSEKPNWKPSRDSGVEVVSYLESNNISQSEDLEIKDEYSTVKKLPQKKPANTRTATNNGSHLTPENIYENVNAYRSALLAEPNTDIRYFSNIPLQSMHL